MTYLDAFILGLIQGLTEFLPVSSSGHLVLTQALLGVKQPGVSFEVVVHLGTLGAVLVFFRREIIGLASSLWTKSKEEQRRMILLLIVGTIPAGLIGLTLKDFFASVFGEPALAAGMLFVTGGILLATRFARQRTGKVTMGSAILMGLGQAMAIMPGISRSGSTIAVGMLAGVEPKRAAEFSFLLAIPAIGGAAILDIDNLLSISGSITGQYLVGALTAFVVALLAVYLVLESIRRGKFEYFAYYCFAAGGLGLYLFL